MGEKARREQARKAAGIITEQFADKGAVIEVGWMATRKVLLSPNLTQQQVDEFRRVYYSGAEHLFSSIMTILDPGPDEPTDRDMRRMTLIRDEVMAFRREMEALLMDKPAGNS